MSALDAYKIRQDFAILDQVVNDEPLVYLDNAATTQKPQVVLDTLMAYYHETMPMFTVVCTLWLSVQQLLTKLVVKSFVSLSMLNQPKRSSLHVERQLVLTGLVVLQSRFLSQEMR